MKVIIKPILIHEVDQLRQIAIKTFVDSYAHLNDPTSFQEYISNAFGIEKLTLEMQNEESFYYFVLLEDDIVGYLKLNVGSSQTEDYNEDYLEVERIYLDVQYQRKGIGERMIKFAIQKGIEFQKSKIWLGVWDQNPKAVLFYKRMGFEKTGSHIFKFGDEDQMDFIMEMKIHT